jgi:enoyl-CoA hydratase
MSTVQIEIKDGVGTLRLAGPRGNAMSGDLVEDLSSAIRTVAGEPSVRVVLLASAHPKLFCPGLDLVALSDYTRAELGGYMLAFATVLTDLFALKKPVVAAVNGAAVAGGCLLALTADWRIVKRGAIMGLNEVKVGVPLPWSAVALLGRNFEGDAALTAGLGNELAEADAFEAAVAERLAEFADKDAYAFGVTKGHLRGAAVASMREREVGLLDEFLDGWFSDGTQARIAKAVAALKSKTLS